jgi:beta-glucosidase
MVKNTGSRAGKEVVQVYYRDEYAAVTPSVKKLCGFTKIYATAGETKRVRFAIPAMQLGDIGADLKPFRAEGELKFFIGTETKEIQYNP